MTQPTPANPQLIGDIRQLIESSRNALAATVNSALTQLYWHIDQRIRSEVLNNQRAGYGEQIVSTLARQLETDYGRGFSAKSLRHMLRFAEVFADPEIVSAVRRQLSWTHIKTLIYIDDPLKHDFYLQMCQQERWSTRTLQERLDSLLFERTALSRLPDELLASELANLSATDQISPTLILKDPYVLDFLGLQDRYLEKDLEDAILRELENFLLELGAGFTFVARQKRLQIDNDDFYIDLLFYNRRLKRLVAIDLKLGDFKAADKGQMELYLRWLAKHEQEPGEAPPLGIILCSGKKQEHIELLELDASGIHVAEYLTELPPKALLQQKLHEAITRSRQRLDNRSVDQNGEEA
ncbi:PDDEXK nuclease domain-containing protein [Methylicorpusculum sp.]|uniref:PDDEXK nuclease domain-containing protein n=1 Tax=Methylicorpusculum sp. TaxID=2713644 RepID=UPI002731607F|nr:PDDEXK nuclease domain-containing protein [Methylicorpusculum sp.]MDP2178076.1 PDDEXK nuclease domain-containing protein [Methylicorpusculum sp.]MDP3529030.1 PDDEXK nuclease domain-containing protein [Methylicorpusculum sp.]MDZ4153713.1 PDDEXK nuclease domain-containing protein [Methylicorpusculum sp.]